MDVPFVAPRRVAVEIPAGTVVIRVSETGPWRAVCRLRAEAGSSEDAENALARLGLVVDAEGGHITAGPIAGVSDRRHADTSVALEIAVPPGLDVTVRAGAAEVTAHGSFANLDIDVAAGHTELEGVMCPQGDVRVHVGSGHVSIHGASVPRGRATVQVGGGAVCLVGRARTVTLCTGAGDIDAVCDVGCRELRCETGAGHIEAELRGVPDALTHLNAHAGDITIRLPSSADADLVLTTRAGGIDAEEGLGLAVSECRESAAGAMVTCRRGGGGPTVTATTEAGDIAVRAMGIDL